MGHGHVTPNADGSKARCGGPGVCTVCNRELVDKFRKTSTLPPWQTVSDVRLLEIIRGFIADRSDEHTRPDMGSEKHLLDLLHVVVDEGYAQLQGSEMKAKADKWDEYQARKNRWRAAGVGGSPLHSPKEQHGEIPVEVAQRIVPVLTGLPNEGINATRYAKLAAYLISNNTDFDDAIVAAQTREEMDAVIDHMPSSFE